LKNKLEDIRVYQEKIHLKAKIESGTGFQFTIFYFYFHLKAF